jgi:cellobiose phosphorylase
LGPDHARYGAGSNSWLTGTASWMYFAATQHILGFRPDYDGIIIDPCIPDSWDGFEMTRNYRGTQCHLTVGKRPTADAKVTALIVDGQQIAGNFLPAELLENKKIVEIQVAY